MSSADDILSDPVEDPPIDAPAAAAEAGSPVHDFDFDMPELQDAAAPPAAPREDVPDTEFLVPVANGAALGPADDLVEGSDVEPPQMAPVNGGAQAEPGPQPPAGEAPARRSPVGCLDILSTEFAIGWVAAHPGARAGYVFARLDGEVIGAAAARMGRPDLERARAEGRLNGYGFVVIFDRTVPAERLDAVEIVSPAANETLPRAKMLKRDRSPTLRLFLFGSPRSGTSEMGATLTSVLNLPWLGEGHAAPLFATAADALQGDPNASNGLVRFMAKENFRDIAVAAAKQAYFKMHGSASFVDKTPGAPMIKAAPFVYECFPDSYFIFLWRNPVANVLSRMVKFGGNFEGHCRDWAASLNNWVTARDKLPHYLQIRQEDMMAKPNEVGAAIAAYIGQPNVAAAIGASLTSGSLERTGAGLGKTSLAETGWTREQIAIFSRICNPAYAAFEAKDAPADIDPAL